MGKTIAYDSSLEETGKQHDKYFMRELKMQCDTHPVIRKCPLENI